MCKFDEGMILSFRSPKNGKEYDGVVWRVISEDETNISLYIRFVDVIGDRL